MLDSMIVEDLASNTSKVPAFVDDMECSFSAVYHIFSKFLRG